MDPLASDAPRADGPGGAAAESRRSFLRAATAVAPAALVATGLAAPGEARAANGANLPNLYPGWNARNFSQIRADENAHAKFFQTALGSDAFPMPQFKNLSVPASQPAVFVSTAVIFENTDIGAYLATGPLLTNAARGEAGGILAVDAMHAGYLNALVNIPLVLNGQTIAMPFSLAGVLQNISPYVVDTAFAQALAAAIGPAPSAQNDIAVFRFALFVEYLASAFYNTNVKTFFGV